MLSSSNLFCSSFIFASFFNDLSCHHELRNATRYLCDFRRLIRRLICHMPIRMILWCEEIHEDEKFESTQFLSIEKLEFEFWDLFNLWDSSQTSTKCWANLDFHSTSSLLQMYHECYRARSRYLAALIIVYHKQR